jgi:Cu-Zn family superoxide dismutase
VDAHAGDLGNIKADFFGVAVVEKLYTIPLFDPEEGSLVSVLGRAVVVHELEDDLGKGDNSVPGKQGAQRRSGRALRRS